MAVTTRDISSGQLLSASALTAGTTTAAFNRDVLDGYNIDNIKVKIGWAYNEENNTFYEIIEE